jgi:hypothetical protein
MGLIRKAACQRNITELFLGRPHHGLRPLNASSSHIRHGRNAETPLERPREVTLTEGDQIGQVARADLGSEVRLNVRERPLRLPPSETARHERLLCFGSAWWRISALGRE